MKIIGSRDYQKLWCENISNEERTILWRPIRVTFSTLSGPSVDFFFAWLASIWKFHVKKTSSGQRVRCDFEKEWGGGLCQDFEGLARLITIPRITTSCGSFLEPAADLCRAISDWGHCEFFRALRPAMSDLLLHERDVELRWCRYEQRISPHGLLMKKWARA